MVLTTYTCHWYSINRINNTVGLKAVLFVIENSKCFGSQYDFSGRDFSGRDLVEHPCQSCVGTGKREYHDRIESIKKAGNKYVEELMSLLRKNKIKYISIGFEPEYYSEGDIDSGIKSIEVMVRLAPGKIEKDRLYDLLEPGYHDEMSIEIGNESCKLYYKRPWGMFEESKGFD